MINNIIMNLLQMKWIKKDHKLIKYELNQFLESFFLLEINFWINSEFFPTALERGYDFQRDRGLICKFQGMDVII
jgi:hypothetical protein